MSEVLIVDDSIMNRTALSEILKDEFQVITAGSGKEMFNILEEHSPELILLDVIMPELDGFEIISKLKVSEEYNKIPVIFITGLDDASNEAKGFALGAIDYITKPFKPNVVKARVRSYVRLYEFIRQTEMLGQHDGLTGLYNKKMTEEQIKKLLNADPPIKCGALMIIDVDNFKGINDTFGHLYGDAVITQLGSSLRSIFQKSDVLGRVGGDEFFAFMRNYNDISVVEQKAKELCAEFCKCYEQGNDKVNISASVGIATTEHSMVYEDIYKYADIALYKTKSEGKNGYNIFSGEESINYKSTRTEIENTKINRAESVENIVDFTNTIKEYIFNLIESNKVSEYTIQSVLQMMTEKFNLSKALVVKLCYEETGIKCIYNRISSDKADTPIVAELSFSSVTLLHNTLIDEKLVLSNSGEHKHIYVPDQDNNKNIAVFPLTNKKVLLGYLVFEKSADDGSVFQKITKEVVDSCQQLSSIIINQFLIDNINDEKSNIENIINSIPEPIYVAKPEVKKPLFLNEAAKKADITFHGKNCFKPDSSCNNCLLKSAINNGGHAEDDEYSCHEISWSNGSSAYVIRQKFQ